MIKYFPAPDIEKQIKEISEKLEMRHDIDRIKCIRSVGSQSRYTIARCHALPRIMQVALDKKAHYAIEVISERFDKMNEEKKTKTLIHELMHIPKSFKGGFRHHGDHVTEKNVNKLYEKFVEK